MCEDGWIVLLEQKTSNYVITTPCASMLVAARFIETKEGLDEVYPTLKLKSQHPVRPDWRFDLDGKPYIYVAHWHKIEVLRLV